MKTRGRAKIHRKFVGISTRANIHTIKEMNKYAFAIQSEMQEVVFDTAEALMRLTQRNVRSLASKSGGRYGVRNEIAENTVVRTQELKHDNITRARVAIDYGFGGLQSLAHLLEYGFTLTASFYGRQRKVPLSITPRPFLRPAFKEIERAWLGRITQAIQTVERGL